MSKMKAVVLEKSGSRYTVLGQDGTFRQVHRRLNAEVGEEVEIQIGRAYFSGLRVWAGVAAMFVLVSTALLGWNLYQAPTAVALLSVDINPSVQIALDTQGHLIKFQTQNEDAKRMLSHIDLKGRSIEEVLEQIVAQAYDRKFLSAEQPWVVVGYSPMHNITLEQMPKELNENQITSWVTKISAQKGLIPQIAVFALTSEEGELAQKGDLTLGEYALWQTADKAGIVTQPEKLKDTSERVRLLENPQVQVQIKVEKDEHQTVLPQTSGAAKEGQELIGKPSNNGTGKLLPSGKLASPTKGLYHWIDMSRSKDKYEQKNEDKDKYEQKNQDKDKYEQKDQDKDKYEQKDQDKDKYEQKNQDKDKYEQKNEDEDKNEQKDQDEDKRLQKDKNSDQQKVKDQEKYQNKDQNVTENNEYKETQRTKYNNISIPVIPTLGNLRHDSSHSYEVKEYDWNRQQRR